MAVRGDYAFVADDWSGLQVIDVSDPENPTWAGACNDFMAANGVTLVGDRAYVAAMDWGVQVVDISDPTDPQRVGEYNTPGLARRIAVSLPYLYVAEFDGGLTILRIANDTGDDFLWNDASDGTFGNPDRWTPPGPPGASDRATFDLPGEYTVFFDGDHTNDRLLVNQGDVNFDLGGWSYYLERVWDDAIRSDCLRSRHYARRRADNLERLGLGSRTGDRTLGAKHRRTHLRRRPAVERA